MQIQELKATSPLPLSAIGKERYWASLSLVSRPCPCVQGSPLVCDAQRSSQYTQASTRRQLAGPSRGTLNIRNTVNGITFYFTYNVKLFCFCYYYYYFFFSYIT